MKTRTRSKKKIKKKVSYDERHVKWVRKIVEENNPTGISRNELTRTRQKMSKIVLDRAIASGEDPPGRERIDQILKDYNGTYFEYKENSGGSGNKSLVTPLELDNTTLLGNLENVSTLHEINDNIKKLTLGRGYDNDRNFKTAEYVNLVTVEKKVHSFPITAVKSAIQNDANYSERLEALVSTTKKQLNSIKKIKKNQKYSTKHFDEIYKEFENVLEMSFVNQIISKILSDRNFFALLQEENIDLDELQPRRNKIRRLMSQASERR